MQVPFLNLSTQNDFSKEFIKDLKRISDNQAFILGEYVSKFENAFAQYNNSRYALGVANGSEAIEIILRSLELPEYSEVLIPANSFIASAQATIRAGMKPVLVDVDLKTSLAEANNFEKGITKKTKVIMAVHLYGQMPDMMKINELAKDNNLLVIEDAAQSQGSSLNMRKMGFFSIAAATSFYPGKNLGAWGDGGAIVTNSKKLYNKVQKIRNYGSVKKYKHEIFGINSRLDEVQAAILIHKLKKLDIYNQQRNELAEIYDDFLRDMTAVNFLPRRNGYFNNYHLYVITLKNRDKIRQGLASAGIQTVIHYPTPIYKHTGLKDYFADTIKKDLPNTDRLSKRILSLPLFPGMAKAQIMYVTDIFRKLYV